MSKYFRYRRNNLFEVIVPECAATPHLEGIRQARPFCVPLAFINFKVTEIDKRYNVRMINTFAF